MTKGFGVLLSVLVSIVAAAVGIEAVDKIHILLGHRILQASAGDWAAFRTHIAHNFFASLLGLGLLVLLLTEAIAQKWRKWAWLALAASFVDVLFLAEGRTSQFSLVLVLGLIFILTPSSWRSLRQVIRQPFVVACLIFYAVLLFGSSYSSVGVSGAAKMLIKVREYLFVPVFFVLFLHVS